MLLSMKKLSPAALDVLTSGLVLSDTSISINRQVDRRLYLELDGALTAIGGTWNKKAKAHLFDENPAEDLQWVITNGGYTDIKSDLDQFFTPPDLAERVVEIADVAGKLVLEPSAGHGALVRECMKEDARRIVCVEADPLCIPILEDLLHDYYADVVMRNFLDMPSVPAGKGFDCIVMNPPFSLQRDIKHVNKAMTLLAPGGKLVAIMGAGVKFRTNKLTTDFRSMVASHGGTIEDLPTESFKASGTLVQTVLVTVVGR